MIARRIWTDPAARRPMAQAAAWGWALLIAVILLAPMLGAWYLVWVLPLAWALPRVARRTLVVLCLAFTVTELVTENSHLPELIRSVRLPFGHPVAIAVCVWIAVDLIRRLRAEHAAGGRDAGAAVRRRFEAGPAMPKHIELPADDRGARRRARGRRRRDARGRARPDDARPPSLTRGLTAVTSPAGPRRSPGCLRSYPRSRADPDPAIDRESVSLPRVTMTLAG